MTARTEVLTELLIPESRLLELAGYLEAGRLILDSLRSDGLAMDLHLRLCEEGMTLLLSTDSDPAAVSAALVRRHLRFGMIDFHDDDDKTIITWQIGFLHHSFGLIAHTAKRPALRRAA